MDSSDSANPSPPSSPSGVPTGVPSRPLARGVAISTLTNWTGMFVSALGNMFLQLYVLRYYDEERFGIYRLAVSLGMWVAMLSLGMEAVVLRLASHSVAGQQWERLGRILSAARLLLLGSAIVGLVVMVIVSVAFQDILKVPADQQHAAAILIQTTALAIGLTLLSILYNGALRSVNRHHLVNVARIGQIVLNVGVVVGCFELGWLGLEVLGLARLAAAAANLLSVALFLRWSLPQVRMSLVGFGRDEVRSVLSLLTWTAVKMGARVTHEQAGVPIISATLGVAAVGGFAIPQMIAQLITDMITGLTLTLWPVAAKYAALGKREQLARLYRIGTRLAMMMTVPGIAVLVTHGRPLIIALKPELEWAYLPMLVYMGLFLARAAFQLGDQVIMAAGAIRPMVLGQVLAVAIGVPLGLLVALCTDWGLNGVVVALFTPLAIQSLLYLPYRIFRETGVRIAESYWGCLAGPLIGGAAPLAVGWGLGWIWPVSGLVPVLFQMGLAAGTYGVVAWFLILRGQEREMFLRALRRDRAA